jgi:hypothetical protein
VNHYAMLLGLLLLPGCATIFESTSHTNRP